MANRLWPFKSSAERDAEAYAKAFHAIAGTRGIFGNELPRTNYDYASDIGDATRSNVVVACLNWLMRHWPEAPLQVIRDEEPNPDHKMLQVIRKPNPFYSGATLWMATVMEFLPHGNAYWRKVRRTPDGPVEQLWWLPQVYVQPRRPHDGSVFLSHYDYSPQGIAIRIEVEDMVHFRWGLDPRDSTKGLSSLAALFREIWTDEEAANFTASLLRNMGVPGLVIAPKELGADVDGDAIKDDFKQNATGDKRGGVHVMSAPMSLEQFGFSPDQMNMRAMRQIPEERVCATLGIQAAVVGFGTGMEQTKVGATMHELREMSVEEGLVPLYALLDDHLQTMLLPDFGDPSKEQVNHDWTKIRVLQDDVDKLITRLNTAVRGGWLQVADAQLRAGFEVDETQHVYLRGGQAVAPGSPPKRFRRLSQKAEGLTGAIEKVRRDGETAIDEALQAFFALQAIEIIARFGGLVDEPGASGNGSLGARATAIQGTKARVDIVSVFDLDAANSTLDTIMFAQYASIDSAMYDVLAEALQLIAYDADGPVAQRIIQEGTQRIKGINSLTHRALIDHLATSESRGYNLFQTVNGVVEDGYPGVASIIEETYQGRATAIARTEAGFATNTAALGRYAEGGVTEVDIIDGEGDEVCASRNGTRVPIDERPNLAHPNCTLVVLPVISGETV